MSAVDQPRPVYYNSLSVLLSHDNFVMEVSVLIANSFKHSVESSNLKSFTRPLLICGLRNQNQKVHVFLQPFHVSCD